LGKIIKLDKNLANQIAAWEVVERPVSVVKELAENSIDAWALFIRVEIVNGWIDKVIVADNWGGIDKEDFHLVTQKYTTSKIKNLEDLYNVMTFGFRWEALASISSVSKLEIISKTKNYNYWYSIISNGWDLWKITQAPSDIWTKIIVENLFFNTPARLNYLKKPRTEYSHILEFMNQISLSYPSIWFEFVSDNKIIFKYKNDEDLKTRIYNIYWEEFSKNLLEINFELNWIKIVWFISDPKISFPNRNRQSLFVNSRIIKSPLVYKAVSDAYNRYIPHSSFPWYVLNLQVDPTQVDVNVHPRKQEIRFANESTIFRWVYHALQDRLEKVSLIQISHQLSQENTSPLTPLPRQVWPGAFLRGEGNNRYYTWSWTKFKSYSPYSSRESNPSQAKIRESINFSKEILSEWSELDKIYNSVYSTWKNSIDLISGDLHDTKLWKIIGQSHNSYIIVETSEWIKFFDQHALAERIIYEKLINNSGKVQTQWLLIWDSLNLTPKEMNVLVSNRNTFELMWFDFEIMSWNNVILNWVPNFIKKENLQKIFIGILEDIWEMKAEKSKTLDEVKNKIYAYAACRSAIKFWDKLNLFEMNKLLNESVQNYSSTCPHWRPVVFEITLNDLKGKYER
jgi:DNA mismatch repair protein MutL